MGESVAGFPACRFGKGDQFAWVKVTPAATLLIA